MRKDPTTMKIEFDPLNAAERAVASRIISIIEGREAAEAPTVKIEELDPSLLKNADGKTGKPSRARRAVEKSREEAAAVSAPVVLGVDSAQPGTDQTVEVTLPPGYEQTSILDAMAPAEVTAPRTPLPEASFTPAKPDAVAMAPNPILADVPLKPAAEAKPTEPAKIPSVEELRNALVAYATAMAGKADAALDGAAKAAWGKDQARKVLNEVGKAASVSAVAEPLRAAVIAACKA